MHKVTYIISDIDKALAFEWIVERLDTSVADLSFILILKKPAALEKFLMQKQINVHSLYYRHTKDLPFVFFKLFRLLGKLKPHTVHCHLRYGSLLGLTAARLAGVRNRIYTRHHSDFHHLYFPKGIKWDKWCNKISTRIVAPSGTVKDVLVKLENVPEDKIEIIHHGFDLDYFREPPCKADTTQANLRYNPQNQKPVIGVISRFTEWKGIQYIIPAFIKLLQIYPDARLLLFNATGDYQPQLQRLLEDIPKKNYQLIVFDNDLSACYKLFDIFVHTPVDTHVEAFGQIYVEALASGVPSIYTLSGIARDFIVNRKNALVVPFCNSEAIYTCMHQIMEDPKLRKNLIEEGWNSVKERFALQRMISQLENLYETCMSSPPGKDININ